jgi:Ca2+-binding EF-hand superfamily protein
VITRAELATVLHNLNPVFWSDDNIDLLMSAVDENGDGRIQYSEFVAWVSGRTAAQHMAEELEAATSAALAPMDPCMARGAIDEDTEVLIAEAFFSFDANNDGIISRQELADVLQHLDPSTWHDEKVDLLLQFADANQDSLIQYSEFVAWVLSKSAARELTNALTGGELGRPKRELVPLLELPQTEEAIREAFQQVDTDGDGFITRTELQNLFRKIDPSSWSPDKVDDLLKAADANNDGRIQYDEFVRWVMEGGEGSCSSVFDALSEASGEPLPSCLRPFASDSAITVSIIRMNGRILKHVTLPLSEPVRTLRTVASEALGGHPCRLVTKGAMYLGNSLTLAAAGLHDGAMVTAVFNTGIVQIAHTLKGSYAALKADGSVVTWGVHLAGGDSSEVAGLLRGGVERVFSTGLAFAALKVDGSVVLWGDRDHGGNRGDVSEELKGDVVHIVSTVGAFAALKSDGSVTFWGDLQRDSVSNELSDVKQVFSNEFAFAALKADGSVVAWGCPERGGDLGRAARLLRGGVVQVFSTRSAFAALKDNGSVVAWGDRGGGGDASSVEAQLRQSCVHVFSSTCAFAALTASGGVVTWGHPEMATCSEEVASHLRSGVTQVFSTQTAFAALKSNGAVVCWGFDGGGGRATEELAEGVIAITATNSAFAARKGDGKVITWGDPKAGGWSDNVSDQLGHDVQAVFATNSAFAALRAGGSIVTWGDPHHGGDCSGVREDLREGVAQVFTLPQAFTVLKVDNSVVMWGLGTDVSALSRLQPCYAPVAAG